MLRSVKPWWLPIAIVLVSTSIILTNSRAGFVSVVIAVITLLVISPNRYQRRVHRKVTLALYLGGAILAVGLFYMSGEALEGRLHNDVSNDLRFQNYPYILSAIQERPVLGYGLGTFDNVHLTYRAPDDLGWFSRAHSDYLELVHSAGLPAAVLLLMSLAMLIAFLARRLKFGLQYRVIIALGITSSLQLALHATVDFPLQIPAVSYLWVSILAMSLAVAYRSELRWRQNNQ